MPDEIHAGGIAHATVSGKSTSTRLSYRLCQINTFVWDIAVNTESGVDPSGTTARRPPRAIVALAAVLFFECAVLVAVAGLLAFELFAAKPTSYLSAIAILILAIAAAIWVFIIGLGALRARPWIRAAALTWQVLQLAVALGSFQGLFARDDVGWVLLVPAVVVLVLLFTRSVMKATARPV